MEFFSGKISGTSWNRYSGDVCSDPFFRSRISLDTWKRRHFHWGIWKTCCNFMSGKRSVIFGAFVFKSDVYKNGFVMCRRDSIFVVRFIPHRPGRRKVAVFSLYMECKGRFFISGICGWKWGRGRVSDRNKKYFGGVLIAHTHDVCHNQNMVSVL